MQYSLSWHTRDKCSTTIFKSRARTTTTFMMEAEAPTSLRIHLMSTRKMGKPGRARWADSWSAWDQTIGSDGMRRTIFGCETWEANSERVETSRPVLAKGRGDGEVAPGHRSLFQSRSYQCQNGWAESPKRSHHDGYDGIHKYMNSLLRDMYKVRDGVKHFWASALLDGWANWMRQVGLVFSGYPHRSSALRCASHSLCMYVPMKHLCKLIIYLTLKHIYSLARDTMSSCSSIIC